MMFDKDFELSYTQRGAFLKVGELSRSSFKAVDWEKYISLWNMHEISILISSQAELLEVKRWNRSH